jgi:hypothetical protein
MPESSQNLTERREKALERFKRLLSWYETTRTRSRILFYTFQTLVIVLSGITPILLLLTNSKVAQAIPPAIASILAGLLSVCQFNDHWLRRSTAAEALKSELTKFETRSGDLYGNDVDEAEALEHFVLRIESIAADEVFQWRQKRSDSAFPTEGSRRGKAA